MLCIVIIIGKKENKWEVFKYCVEGECIELVIRNFKR